MIRFVCTFFFACFAISAQAQTEASDYSRIGFAGFLTTTVSDYQSVGINPANLGFRPQPEVFDLSTPMEPGLEIRKRPISISLLEGGISLHSDALDRSGLFDMITQTSSGSFTPEDKARAAEAFIDKAVRFSVDLITLGVSYQSDNWGGVAVTVRERMSGTYLFSEGASRLAFEGRHYSYFDSSDVNFFGDTVGISTDPKTYSELFDGTRISTLWFREIGLSYGLKVADFEEVQIYAGAGGKYLLGYAFLDARVTNGQLQARSSISPLFGVSYGKAVTPSAISGDEFVPVGTGWSMDFGLTVRYNDFSFAASVVDIGEILWDGNVYQAEDTILNGMTSEGFNSYNLFEEAPKITGEGNYFRWGGLVESTSRLPARVRLGSSWQWNKNWRFGFDAIFPVNSEAGSLDEPIVSVGADWRPLPWLRAGFGMGGGGNMGLFMPVSVLFSVLDGVWELGISSRDVLTYVLTSRPVLSVVVGVARIRL